jgi:chemotaxis protein CheC
MDYRNLSSIQLDALREVFNIGSGNAATSLSWLLNKKVDMGVPKIEIVQLQDVVNSDLDYEVIAVVVKVIGEAPGSILYIFDKKVAVEIAEILIEDHDVFSEMGMSTMAEIGNIIASSYMNAIVSFTGLKMIPSVPAVTYDMFNAVLPSTFIESGQYDEYILDIETLFKGDNGCNVIGNFYYIPEPGSLENILLKLGMN